MRNRFWCVVVLVGCATTQSGGAGPGGMPESCSGDLGSGEASAKLAPVVDAGGGVLGRGGAAAGPAGAPGRDAGGGALTVGAAAELEASGTDTASVCAQVAARVQAEMEKARAEASIEAKLEIVEPVCTTKVEEYKRCIERCEPRVVRPGYVDYHCEGGELRGG